MGLPKVKIAYGNGNLGQKAASEDGICGIMVSGVAVAGKFALGDILTLYSLDDAKNLGIDAAYDTTNTCAAYQQIKEFYDEAPTGTQLYVMVVAKTVTMTQMCDKDLNYAAKLLSQTQGKIKHVGITRIPDGAYTPTYDDQFEQDLWDAVTKAKALRTYEEDHFRPVSFWLGGRNFQGAAATAKDLRDPLETNANCVSIVIGNDYNVAISAAHYNKYTSVGLALGKKAAGAVQENIGKVKKGKLKVVTKPGFSNGAAYESISETNLEVLANKGYIFLIKHPGKDGIFFNGDHTAAPVTDDYSSQSRRSAIDKAARITRLVYLEELLDDVELDPTTGKLSAGTIKAFQANVEEAINAQMTAAKEITKVTCFVDPDQDVLATNKIVVEVSIIPKGMTEEISVTLALDNPSN